MSRWTSDRELIDAIESSLHLYPAVPGLSTNLGVPGMQGRVTNLSHLLANLVGMARFFERDANAVVAKVRQRFTSEKKAFGWVIGPGTTPRDLDRRLAAEGLRPIAQLAGMAVTDLALPILPNPAVRIREVTPNEAAREAEMMGRAYGMPTEIAAPFTSLIAASPASRSRGYFAYLDGDAPVAWSYLVYLPTSPIVLLGGAATLPEARGKGIYSALVKHGLDDARADGRTAAIIQADRDTSAPICAKLGFRELRSLVVYGWAPEP
ncbi:MAG TPA: GNAT family N-acetyltransferase [Candidatus Limnocylindria bacterium]|nr:GNAT family N-acetyltransferase [Candidatus Limnocylindria bacterium]